MSPSDRTSRVEAFRRDMRARADERRAEWVVGLVRLGGTHRTFAGISDPVLRSSYLDSARHLLDNNRDRLPQFALPIFFLQRHALELGLKHAIKTVAYYHHVACGCPGPEPDAPRHHDLKKLLRHLKEWLRPEAADETVALIQRLVQRFHKLDAGSTWSRFRDDTKPVQLDLDTARDELEEMFKRLFADPTDLDEPVGWIVEYAYLTGELLTRDHLADGESAD